MSATKIIFSTALSAVGLSLIFNPSGTPLITSTGISLIGGLITYWIIPIVAPLFIKVGLFGKDVAKKDKPILAESMGAVCATVYMFCMLLFIPFMFYKFLVTATSGGGNRDQGFEESASPLNGRTLPLHLFPHNKLAEYLSALLCLQSMLLLGMADDLFDIRWRNKFFLPAIASVPLLVVYYVDFGVTKVVLPPFLQFYGSSTIDLGVLYYVYMAMVAIFCPNSINIYAGINGLEVGQAIVIAICILLNDLLYIILIPTHPAVETHLLSAYFVLPLIGVSLALLAHNWFPAKVFVGDTFCYFAGMVFAVVGILGHFSKTLLLFFIPEIFNFIYSIPQLIKIVDCPRHRLPRFNEQTGLREPSKATIKNPSKFLLSTLRVLAQLKLVGLWEIKPNVHYEISNLTLINLVLVWLGPLREDTLLIVLLSIQLTCGVTAIILRHTLAAIVFGRDNL